MDEKEVTKLLINDEDEREQKIHELIRGKRSLNINTESSKKLTTGQKAADKMAQFAGSWWFLGVFGAIVLIWAIVNTKLILQSPFDPYPFVFLNLVLACVASIQAPIIMMSQNRESQKDRLKMENDYLINLKSEIILEDLHIKIDDIIKVQKKLKKELNDININMSKMNTKIEAVSDHIDLRRELNGKTNYGGKNSGGKEPRLHN